MDTNSNSNKSNDDEDDLYADLTEEKLANSIKRNHDAKKKPSYLIGGQNKDFFDVDYVNQLRHEIAQLKEENNTLKRNIGTLYRTAKIELERKDRELATLQSKKK